MSRTIHKLTDAFVKSDRLTAGRHSDGGGLYLNVKPGGSRSWVFMFNSNGKRRVAGLGPYPAIKLSVARKTAEEYRELVAQGKDPIVLRQRNDEPTFAQCVDLFLASMEGQWRNEKHRRQWRMTLGEAYCKRLLQMRVSAIATDDVLAVLTPVWQTKAETASRVRGRIERVLDYAKARGWRSGENPALWRGHLRNILPPRAKLTRGHHAAMAYADVPAFIARLQNLEAMSARALEFLILTASRSGEVLGARWTEIDIENKVWTIPATRMKAGRMHRVPLANSALELLKELQKGSVSEFVFPGQRPNRPLSGMAMEMLLRRMKTVDVTVHGFRSSFRDWAGEESVFPRELAEAALAHVIGDATERAYRRGDALAKRSKLMESWCEYVTGY